MSFGKQTGTLTCKPLHICACSPVHICTHLYRHKTTAYSIALWVKIETLTHTHTPIHKGAWSCAYLSIQSLAGFLWFMRDRTKWTTCMFGRGRLDLLIEIDDLQTHVSLMVMTTNSILFYGHVFRIGQSWQSTPKCYLLCLFISFLRCLFQCFLYNRIFLFFCFCLRR